MFGQTFSRPEPQTDLQQKNIGGSLKQREIQRSLPKCTKNSDSVTNHSVPKPDCWCFFPNWLGILIVDYLEELAWLNYRDITMMSPPKGRFIEAKVLKSRCWIILMVPKNIWKNMFLPKTNIDPRFLATPKGTSDKPHTSKYFRGAKCQTSGGPYSSNMEGSDLFFRSVFSITTVHIHPQKKPIQKGYHSEGFSSLSEFEK